MNPVPETQIPAGALPTANAGTVKIGESKYEIVPVHKMNWPELRALKRLAGMPPNDVGAAMSGLDPDAWFAILYVSIKRVSPALTEEKLEQMLVDHPLVEIVATAEQIPAETPLPPPPASPSVEPSVEPEPSSGDATPPASTPDPSGLQD